MARLPLAVRESQHTEWKEFWRDERLRWVCGFANAEGGVPIRIQVYNGELMLWNSALMPDLIDHFVLFDAGQKKMSRPC